METLKDILLEFNKQKNNQIMNDFINNNFDDTFKLITNFNINTYKKSEDITFSKNEILSYFEKMFKYVYINYFIIDNNKYKIKLYYDHECIIMLEFTINIINNIFFNINIQKI